MRVAPEGFQRRDGISTLADDRNEILLEEEGYEGILAKRYHRQIPCTVTSIRGETNGFFSSLFPNFRLYIHIYIYFSPLFAAQTRFKFSIYIYIYFV